MIHRVPSPAGMAWLLAGAAWLLAGAVCATPALADPAVPLRDSVPHITATGEASAEVAPDQAELRLSVSNERPGADDAAAATAAQAAAVIEAMKAQGVPAADIRSSFSLAAQYDTATDPQSHLSRRVLRGYAASVQVTARLHDVSKAGALARALIGKGANGFQGIDYSYSKERELQRRLDGEAAKDAEATARTTVEALGLGLGRVLQINEDAVAPPMPRIVSRMAFDASSSAAIPMEAGTQRVTRNVTVIFEIENKAR